MARIRKEKKKPMAPETKARIEGLEAEIDVILDRLSESPDDRGLIERLAWTEKRILDLSGEHALEVNEDFRR